MGHAKEHGLSYRVIAQHWIRGCQMYSGFHLESNRNSDVTSMDNDWGLQDRDRHIYILRVFSYEFTRCPIHPLSKWFTLCAVASRVWVIAEWHHRYGMTSSCPPFAGAFVSDIFGLSLSSPVASFVSTLRGWVISFQHHQLRLMSLCLSGLESHFSSNYNSLAETETGVEWV